MRRRAVAHRGPRRAIQGESRLPSLTSTVPLSPAVLASRLSAPTKVVSCASERCELVSILGADFVRLMEKSSAVRALMHDVTAARKLE